MLAGSVQVSTGTKTSLSFQDGPVFTRVHRRENLPIDDSCEDEKQAARRAGLAFEVALMQSAQSAVVDAPGEGV